MDGENPVDATGSLTTIGYDFLDGGAAASMALAESEDVAQCFAKQWFRFGMGRVETRADASSVRQITSRIMEGASLREALISLTTSYSFRHRRGTALDVGDE